MNLKTWALTLLMSAPSCMALASSMQEPEENNSRVQALRLLPPEMIAEIITYLPVQSAHDFVNVVAYLGHNAVDPVMIKGWQSIRDLVGRQLNDAIKALAPAAQKNLFRYVLAQPLEPLSQEDDGLTPAMQLARRLLREGCDSLRYSSEQEILSLISYSHELQSLWVECQYHRVHIIRSLGAVQADQIPAVLARASELTGPEMEAHERMRIFRIVCNVDAEKVSAVISHSEKLFSLDYRDIDDHVIQAFGKVDIDKMPILISHIHKLSKHYRGSSYEISRLIEALGNVEAEHIPDITDYAQRLMDQKMSAGFCTQIIHVLGQIKADEREAFFAQAQRLISPEMREEHVANVFVFLGKVEGSQIPITIEHIHGLFTEAMDHHERDSIIGVFKDMDADKIPAVAEYAKKLITADMRYHERAAIIAALGRVETAQIADVVAQALEKLDPEMGSHLRIQTINYLREGL